VAPLGYQSPDFVLQASPLLFIPGTVYAISLTGAISSPAPPLSGDGLVTAKLFINSAPAGGAFAACVLNLGTSGCVKEGLPLADTFRMSATGWSDQDSPMMYKFGYELQGGMTIVSQVNGSNATTSANMNAVMWFSPSTKNYLDMEFSSGTLLMYCAVYDSLGARTAILVDKIVVGDTTTGGRRLLASANEQFAKAKAKMNDNLKAFRANEVNQLSGSMALEGSKKLTPEEANKLRGELMSQVTAGTRKTVGTAAYACESFGAGVLIAGSPDSMNKESVVGAGSLLFGLSTGKKSFMSEQCTGAAALILSNALLAQRLVVIDGTDGSTFMNNVLVGMQSVMMQAAIGKVAGESATTVAALGMISSINRLSLQSLVGASFFSSSPAASYLAQRASFHVPTSLSSVFGSSSADINVQHIDLLVQTHSFTTAPSASGSNIVSPLFGLTLSYADTGTEAVVKNLTEPFIITIPVELGNFNVVEKMLFTQQVKCVYWGGSSYISDGCNVTSASSTSVTCSCNHLATFGISQDSSIAA
jgi:hypothetical protein